MKFAFVLAAAMIAASPAYAAASLSPFSASYQVLKDGKRAGTATIRLQRNDRDWTLRTHTRAEHGLAGLLGLDIDERSIFRMRGEQPEMLSYRYRLDAGIRKRQRDIDVDWQKKQVSVDTGKHRHAYAAVAGMVERHLLPLVLGGYLGRGAVDVSLPVAVKDRVESQHFRSAGTARVKTPIGQIDALRVARTDDGKAFTAWYAPQRYVMPVKLVHDDYTMLLQSWTSP